MKEKERTNGIPRKYAFVFIITFVLLIRFFFELRLASQFNINQGIKLNFCLTNQPYYAKTSQTFYYQNHFQRVKIKTDVDKKYDFGDCLQISGKIEACSSSSNTEYCLLNPTISTYQPPFRFQFLKKMRKIRQSSAQFYLQNLPYPYSDLLAGVVLGVKKHLDPDFHDQLRQTGTLHIIVASGYNLTVSGKVPADYLAYLIGRGPALVVGIFLVWFYVCLVGWQPPIVRAGILLTIIFIAQLVGRKFSQLRSLLFTVWLMLMIKPDLITSISFQLSFAALLGIMLGSKMFKRFKNIPLIGTNLAETVSAQLLVAPIIAYHFGRLSLLAPLTNALILPLVPTLTWGGISGLLGHFLPFLGRLVLLILYPFLWWPVSVVNWFSQFWITEISFSLPIWGVVVSYLIIFLVFHIKLTTGKKKKSRQNQSQLFPD